ncbi:MAG: hypothetical protein ACC707_12335 [Thiohalomonadales bacterium]
MKMWNSVRLLLRSQKIAVYYITIVLIFLIAGCSSESDDSKTDKIAMSGIAIPNSIQALALPSNTSSFTANLYLDDASEPLASATIAIGNQNTVGFNNIDVSTGMHSFRIEFILVTADYELTLASVRSDSIDITAGSSNVLDFQISNYNYDYDLDNDRVTNIEEIAANSPPNNDKCVLGVSLIGHCKLGV